MFITPKAMSYTELYKTIKENTLIQGGSIEHLERKETLYYDETENVKHLIIKNGSLNAKFDTVFVLGGIQAEDTISIESLKSRLGKQPTTELKATNDLKGDFIAILRKDNFRQILELIQEKKWHIHFSAAQILYYAFVDIVDSIEGTEIRSREFKAELYQVLKKDCRKTVEHFKKYKYPNIKDSEKEEFLEGIIRMIEEQIKESASKYLTNPLLMSLKKLICTAKRQKELTFIQKEETGTWVESFIQFYRQEIIKFHRKNLIFDEEKQVQRGLKEEDLEINRKLLTNYSFIDSKTNAMIQVSDYVVSIIKKYIMFLDRTELEIEQDIKNFDDIQKRNYVLLNTILKDSLDYNPLFLNFTVCLYTYKKIMKYIKEYSCK
ncbi:hypothetical protein CAPSP0001_1793 [Capnocytophaga sputigena ATCC 33612]|uniref:Uncharacterized protein n=2 Tax=Capnocytophaga sputigena TaxID=1019 RepID=A0ABN5BFV3_CAPSP|nr:hypothetical protein CGC55_01100 [Capnocytophaga sputigena]EEB66041.1 hypothetical protein CAPSP0001_1793 [Capnocytophaga sputigena ATCC 33612]